MAKGKLVLLGSGETAPGMTKVHRELLSGLGEVRAVNLDTPYGFQLNVPQMTQKLVDYFKVSLQTDLKPLSFTNYEKSSGVERELFRQSVREANYVFAGPGSPSYALAQWKGLDLQEDLLHVLDNGGVVCFSSAAALTLGAFTAPIYEIYKAGAEPYWLEGLNLMGLLGINCAVIPHFNNAEGKDYDTSCCYLGKDRLAMLKGMLPVNVNFLGIDEHTALMIDMEKHEINVHGKGKSYWSTTDEAMSFVTVEKNDLSRIQIHEIQPRKNLKTLENTRFLSPLELAKEIESNGEEKTKSLSDLVQRAISADLLKDKHDNIINKIIILRQNHKSKGSYDFSDEIRNLLNDLNIEVIDNKENSSWKIKE